jgi:hypothetical protein
LMARVIHYRLHGLPSGRLERVERQLKELAAVREWRSGAPWLASPRSRGLFEMEYLRHLQLAEGPDVSAGGFLKMAGDETDALMLLFFVRDLSAEYAIRTVLRDDENPLAKLRYLEFRRGRLPSGHALEDVLARRPIIKKVMGQAIMFYPPSYRVHSQSPPGPGHWGYALCGLRAFAPSLLEAEQEALKILRGLRHLGR